MGRGHLVKKRQLGREICVKKISQMQSYYILFDRKVNAD